MPKFDRLLYLVEYLRRSPFASLDAICRKCEISERTFYRDVSYLRSRNILIEYDAERGGYYLANKTYLQSLTFSAEEALAIQMALNARPLRNTPFGRAARSALTQIEAAMITEIGPMSDMVGSSFVIEATSLAEYDDDMDEIFNALHKAWYSRRVLCIEYEARSDPPDTPRERLVDVYGAFTRGSAWYMVGYCHYFGEPRTFKIKRIKRAVLTDQSYTIPSDFSIVEYVRDSWQLFRGEPKVNVAARFLPSIAHLVLEEKYHSTQETTLLEDGSVLFRARVAGWREFGWWLRQFGDEVEALEPPELRAEFARLGKKFTEIYGKD